MIVEDFILHIHYCIEEQERKSMKNYNLKQHYNKPFGQSRHIYSVPLYVYISFRVIKCTLKEQTAHFTQAHMKNSPEQIIIMIYTKSVIHFKGLKS